MDDFFFLHWTSVLKKILASWQIWWSSDFNTCLHKHGENTSTVCSICQWSLVHLKADYMFENVWHFLAHLIHNHFEDNHYCSSITKASERWRSPTYLTTTNNQTINNQLLFWPNKMINITISRVCKTGSKFCWKLVVVHLNKDSIHLQHRLHPGRGCSGPGANPRITGQETGRHPVWDATPSQGITHSFTPSGNLVKPIHLLACIWKVEGNWRTCGSPCGHAENMRKPYTDSNLSLGSICSP